MKGHQGFRHDDVVYRAEVLLADPEERRSFMDMRLLLVRGDMGDAESLPASPRAGLSPRRISRQEPEEEDGRSEEGAGIKERR